MDGIDPELERSDPATRALSRRGGGTAPLLLALLRKPAVVGSWLRTARAAQVAFVLLTVWLFWLWPPALEATLDQLHPPENRHKRVLGFIRVQRQDVRERIESERAWATRAMWGLSGGVVLWLLWTHVGTAVTEATALARRREREADAAAPGSSKRQRLYRSAHRLTLDRERESLLLHKLERDVEESPVPGPTGRARDRYRMLEEIGRGGMGVVYRGFDPRLDRHVALKHVSSDLLADPDLTGVLQREAHALARLSHPHIVQIFDIVEDRSGLWIVLEFVDGTDVSARIRETGPFPPDEVAAIGAQLADALAYAHSRDLLHRDVKPANVLLTAEGRAKLTDFGIAKLLEADGDATRKGIVLGSPSYMSPEHRRGAPLDAKTDVYSLGVTLYEMLTGHVPEAGEDRDEPRGALALPRPSDAVDLPRELDALVMQMLARSPQDRPASMEEVASVLSALGKRESAPA